MYNLKSEMNTLPPQNMMLIAVFYNLPLVIGDPILLCGFKIGDKVLDQLGLGAIFIVHSSDGDFIVYDRH